MLRKGRHRGQALTKARIRLKADVSESGEGWSDSRIIEALGTNSSTVRRVRKQLVEEGFDAVLGRKSQALPVVARSGRGSQRPASAFQEDTDDDQGTEDHPRQLEEPHAAPRPFDFAGRGARGLATP
jgi:Homeodomain-like domain